MTAHRPTKAVSSALTAMLCLTFAASAGASEQSWQEAMDAGTKAFKEQKFPKALECFTRALKDSDSFPGNSDSKAKNLNDLALVYDQIGRRDKARELYQQSLDLKRKTHGNDYQDLIPTLNNMASSYMEDERFDEAEKSLLEANRIIEKAGKDDPRLCINLNRLSAIYRSREDYDRAEKTLLQSLETARKVFGEGNPAVAVIQNNLAVVKRLQNKPEEAESLYKSSLKIREDAGGKDGLGVAASLNNLPAATGSRENSRRPSRFSSALSRL
ncbi:MAG: tetratricopeptide repeat protein [Candidatus Melainabacteria bacterium]|nr:tetratricopeptide repeat protein [Candidatus Melainabacteria bacterium]